MPAGIARVAGLVKVPQRLIEPIGCPVRHAREYSRRRHPQTSVLAPHARWRRQVVSYDRPATSASGRSRCRPTPRQHPKPSARLDLGGGAQDGQTLLPRLPRRATRGGRDADSPANPGRHPGMPAAQRGSERLPRSPSGCKPFCAGQDGAWSRSERVIESGSGRLPSPRPLTISACESGPTSTWVWPITAWAHCRLGHSTFHASWTSVREEPSECPERDREREGDQLVALRLDDPGQSQRDAGEVDAPAPDREGSR